MDEKEKRQFDEFLHLDLKVHDRSNNYDKQLFYYNASVILLMLFCVKELLNDKFCGHVVFMVFIPPFVVIFLCGWSSIALMRTLNLTIQIFEFQKKIIFQQTEEVQEKLTFLELRNQNYNKCAFWSFVCATCIAFGYIVGIVIYINCF
jgi:hypothetical protein